MFISDFNHSLHDVSFQVIVKWQGLANGLVIFCAIQKFFFRKLPVAVLNKLKTEIKINFLTTSILEKMRSTLNSGEREFCAKRSSSPSIENIACTISSISSFVMPPLLSKSYNLNAPGKKIRFLKFELSYIQVFRRRCHVMWSRVLVEIRLQNCERKKVLETYLNSIEPSPFLSKTLKTNFAKTRASPFGKKLW